MPLTVFRSINLVLFLIFCFVPWAIYFYHVILLWNHERKLLGWSTLNPFSLWRLRKMRKSDPRLNYLWGRTNTWFVITLLSWVTWFGITLGCFYFFGGKLKNYSSPHLFRITESA